jgi:transcriptional regulator with XRE-family HTH domain
LNLKETGGSIKFIREALKMKREDSFVKVKITVTTISDYESGKKKSNLKFLFPVASQFDINLDYPLLGKEKSFAIQGVESDRYLNDDLFGDSLKDVKEIIFKMKRSKMILTAIISQPWTYLYRNSDIIEMDIRSTEINKKIRKIVNEL